jgi:hypothetical protein
MAPFAPAGKCVLAAAGELRYLVHAHQEPTCERSAIAGQFRLRREINATLTVSDGIIHLEGVIQFSPRVQPISP